MKKLVLSLILYIGALGLTAPVYAAFSCQVTYGGGEVCQNQPAKQFSYPPNQPTATPTPTPIANSDNSGLSNLPSTGASGLVLFLMSASGVVGVVLLLI